MKRSRVWLVGCTACMLVTAVAQEEPAKVRFLDHLSVSIEVSNTGIGVEAATPLHPNFVLRAGFVFIPSVSDKGDYHIHFYGGGDRHFDELVKEVDGIYKDLRMYGLPTSADGYAGKVVLNGKLKWYDGKALIDYYPFSDGRFCITAGLYFGNRKFLVYSGRMPADYMRAVRIVNRHLPEGERFMPLVGNWETAAESTPDGSIDFASDVINAVKPYLGIGVGRAVPRKRVGCQFNVGCMYVGKSSPDNGSYYIEGGALNMFDLSLFRFFPVVSLRLTGRIF